MTDFVGWFSPDVMRLLGWALLHFLWQGLALAGLLSALMAVCRSAAARYALAVGTLALMVTTPAVTFLLIRQASSAGGWAGAGSLAGIEMSRRVVGFMTATTSVMPDRALPADRFLWLVEGWFAGVFFFSLRAAGGLWLVERLRRTEVKPAGPGLQQTCLVLQRRLGLDRVIRYCECRLVEAPAVIGWFRPVVLLPATALTGLSAEQLEAVIVHELAHIRRLDCFVNLFQLIAETLLFYHPAVWWVSRRIRVERENCCDDVAVRICGDAAGYARTLMQMEEWRSAPSLAMAAKGSPLAARVGRLLGARRFMRRTPGAGLVAGLLCLAGALLVGNTLGVAHGLFSLNAGPRHINQTTATLNITARPGPSAGPIRRAATPTALISQASAPHAAQEKGKQAAPPTADAKKEEQTGKESFIEGLKSAGLENLTVDQLLAMKIQGVTPQYVRQVHELGLRPGADELIAMRTQGVTAEYIRDMRAAGLNLTADQLIGMKVQGVTPEYVRGMHELGLRTDADELVGMRVQGVTPEYIRDMRAAGLNLTTDQLIGMKVQGVTPEYVRGMHELGLRTDADELLEMRVQGVTPEHIRDIRAVGLNPTVEQLVAMRVQGVTPAYVRALQAAGLRKLRIDDYLAAKVQGITPEFIEKARKHGFQNLNLDKLIALKQAGVL